MNYPWIDEYMLSKQGVYKEYKVEWETWRFMIGDKLVALYSNDSQGRDVITMKCDPGLGAVLREGFEDIRPGYHMNKIHWNSFDLNGNAPDDVLKQMLDNSYDLVFASLTKKAQKEVLEG